MKPVAWNIKENRPPYSSDNPNDIVALYTAPRELSEAEIYDIYVKHSSYDDGKLFMNVFGFAREILKKASEK